MSWLFVSIIAYFLTALNSVVDKYLLHRSIPHPIVYSFYVGLFSAFTIVLTPFGIDFPGVKEVLIALLVGIIYLFALVAFFYALKEDEASRIVSLVGGMTPIFIMILSSIFLGEYLTKNQLIATVFLIIGGIIISARKNQKCGIFEFHKYECVQSTEMAMLASFLFAVFFVSVKHIFNTQDFVSGFIWTRIGSFVGALLLLAVPTWRLVIKNTTKSIGARAGSLFVANKTLAGVAFFLLNYGISLGNVTVVNALEGVKYLFVLILVFLLTRFSPDTLTEETKPLILLQKISAVICIFAGIFILALK